MLKNDIIIFVLFLFFLVLCYQSYQINCLKKEHFATVSSIDPQITDAVKKIYLADVEAIRLLSNFAIQLTNGGLTVPGSINFNNNCTISGNLVTMGTSAFGGKLTANDDVVIGKSLGVSGEINTTHCKLTGNLTANQLLIGKWAINQDANGNLNFYCGGVPFVSFKSNSWQIKYKPTDPYVNNIAGIIECGALKSYRLDIDKFRFVIDSDPADKTALKVQKFQDKDNTIPVNDHFVLLVNRNDDNPAFPNKMYWWP